MAISLQSDLRGLSGEHTHRRIRPQKASAFLLAQAAEGDVGEIVVSSHANGTASKKAQYW